MHQQSGSCGFLTPNGFTGGGEDDRGGTDVSNAKVNVAFTHAPGRWSFKVFANPPPTAVKWIADGRGKLTDFRCRSSRRDGSDRGLSRTVGLRVVRRLCTGERGQSRRGAAIRQRQGIAEPDRRVDAKARRTVEASRRLGPRRPTSGCCPP